MLLCCLSHIGSFILHLFIFLLLSAFSIGSSGDSTARIWTIPDGPCGSSMQISPPNVYVLKHFRGRTNEKSKDVTTLDWSVSSSHTVIEWLIINLIQNFELKL